MDRINADHGFLPGVFGKRKRKDTGITQTSDSEKMAGPRASPLFRKIPNGIRNHFLAMAGEFVGTFMFLFFAFSGTQVANTPQTTTGSTGTGIPQGPNPQALLYISLCFGFSLAVNAWIFFRVTGGLFNPAVTLGLCLIGAVPFVRGGLIFIAQMLGGICSAAIVRVLFPGPLAVGTSLSGGTSVVQGLFIEMFLTAQLVFTIFMLAAEKHKGTFLAPVGIGLSLFIAELGGVYYTGGSLNPARSFGPAVANRSFPHEHWIYWLGPVLGALVSSGFFWFIKSCEYETVNPGQDFDDLEAQVYKPEVDLTRPVVSPNAPPVHDQDDEPTTMDERQMSDNYEASFPQPQGLDSQAAFSQTRKPVAQAAFSPSRDQEYRATESRGRDTTAIGGMTNASTTQPMTQTTTQPMMQTAPNPDINGNIYGRSVHHATTSPQRY